MLDILLKEAVEKQAETLTQKESGCQYMFTENKIEQLSMMYQVFNRTPSTLVHIINKMNPYILQEGAKIVSNEENLKDPIKFTIKLLEFKSQMDDLIEKAFYNDMRFQKAREPRLWSNCCSIIVLNPAWYFVIVNNNARNLLMN